MPHPSIPRRTFLWLPAAATADAGISARATAAVRRHLDLLLDACGRAAEIKGKDAAALTSMCFEILHASTGDARYRRAAVELAGRVLAAMRASATGVLPIKEKEKGGEKFLGGGPPALGWYAACLAWVLHRAGGREADMEYVAQVVDRFPWNPDGWWANTIEAATGRPGIIERPTQVNKNASMVMAAAVLCERLPPAGAALAARLRAKGLTCLRRRILPAQMSDGFWHYGLTDNDPKNKDVLGYFLLSAGLLVRVRRLAPSFRDAALDAALDRAAQFAATRIAGRYDAATDPRRVFDLILLLADTGRTAQAARILDSAFEQFPYGNAGQDGARCACDLATLLLRA